MLKPYPKRFFDFTFQNMRTVRPCTAAGRGDWQVSGCDVSRLSVTSSGAVYHRATLAVVMERDSRVRLFVRCIFVGSASFPVNLNI